MRTNASVGGQLFGLTEQLEDTAQIQILRDRKDYEGLIELGKALSRCFRYREAIEIYTRAIDLAPDRPEGYRLRGGRYLSTLNPQKALSDFEICRQMGGDESDLAYRTGLAHFYLKSYSLAKKEMERCREVSTDELGIAAIYWHMISSWRSNTASVLLQSYTPEMDVGHHTAYAWAVRNAYEQLPPNEVLPLLTRETSDLEYSMMAYGTAEYMRCCGMPLQADRIHMNILRRNSFWISYAYLAEWCDQFGLQTI